MVLFRLGLLRFELGKDATSALRLEQLEKFLQQHTLPTLWVPINMFWQIKGWPVEIHLWYHHLILSRHCNNTFTFSRHADRRKLVVEADGLPRLSAWDKTRIFAAAEQIQIGWNQRTINLIIQKGCIPQSDHLFCHWNRSLFLYNMCLSFLVIRCWHNSLAEALWGLISGCSLSNHLPIWELTGNAGKWTREGSVLWSTPWALIVMQPHLTFGTNHRCQISTLLLSPEYRY